MLEMGQWLSMEIWQFKSLNHLKIYGATACLDTPIVLNAGIVGSSHQVGHVNDNQH